jgi:hypothetical protein
MADMDFAGPLQCGSERVVAHNANGGEFYSNKLAAVVIVRKQKVFVDNVFSMNFDEARKFRQDPDASTSVTVERYIGWSDMTILLSGK